MAGFITDTTDLKKVKLIDRDRGPQNQRWVTGKMGREFRTRGGWKKHVPVFDRAEDRFVRSDAAKLTRDFEIALAPYREPVCSTSAAEHGARSTAVRTFLVY